MKSLLKILSLTLCLYFVTGCSTDNVETLTPTATVQNTCQLSGSTPPPQENLTYNLAGTDIYYTILSSSATHLTVNILTMSCTEMTFGESFYIEKEVDGNFEEVKWKSEVFFNAIAFIITSDQSVEKTYKWNDYLGPLESGKYRIVTDFYRNSEKITAHFEFTTE